MSSHPRELVVGSDHRLIEITLWRTLLACFAAIALACVGALAAAPLAQAATTIDSYGYLASFGSPDYEQHAIVQHNGVAVDGDGNILTPQDVPSLGIGVYAPDASLGGTSLTTIDLSTANDGGPVAATDLAVDPTNGALYFMSFGTERLFRYVSDGQPTPTYTQDTSFASPSIVVTTEGGGMAVDPTTHDLLITDFESPIIWRIDPTGAEVDSIVLGTKPVSAGALAVGQSGEVYVLDKNGVDHFASDGTKLAPLPLPAGFAPASIAANYQSGEVAVLGTNRGEYYLLGFSAADTPSFSQRVLHGTFTLPANPPPHGLTWDPGTDRIYYATDYGAVHTFAPAPAPGLDTPVATNVTATTADLSAGLAPAGVTNGRLEVCPVSPAFNPCSNYPVSAPLGADPANPWQRLTEQEGLSGSSLVDTATDLLPNTTYAVRGVALNTTAGTETTSSLGTFHTSLSPPTVTTGTAGAITDSSAVLTGSIDNTFGDPTGFHFEYGLTTSYGSRMPTSSEAVGGASREPRTVSRSITGLQPGTTYHFRIVATNAAGSTVGADQTFTTSGADEIAPGRAYEQVSPVDKEGAVILNLTQFSIAPDGSSMVIPVSAAPPGATGTLIFQHFVVHRQADGWSDWKQTDPPQDTERGTFETATLGISEDYEHALVVSNRALALGGEAGKANLYIFDVTSGAYTFVASSVAPDSLAEFAGLQQNQTRLEGGAPDFSWVVFHSPVPLTDGGPTNGLYKWSQDGGLTLLSRNPDDTPVTEPVWALSNFVLSARMVSADGSAAYFFLRGPSPGEGGIFRRADGQTVPISVSQAAGGPVGVQPGWLDGVSADGNYAIFRSRAKLTDDATETPEGVSNIYRYDASDDSREYLTTGGAGEGAVYAVSSDTQTFLYGSDGGLTIWREGVVQIVDSRGVPTGRAVLSPNGRYVAYRLASSGGGAEYAPVYVYDTATQERTCVSCSPLTGTEGDQAYSHFDARGFSNFVPQVVTDNGMIFFDTPDALVPADHNSARDVYAFQNGQHTLISPGDGDYQAHFMTASNNGRDVFFTTSEGLVGQDTDQAIDVYDARVGGGFPSQNPPPPPASCVRAECGELGARPISAPGAPSETTKPDAGARLKISLGKVSLTSKAVKVTVRASHAGRLTASGPWVLKTRKRIPKAGTYRISVPLSKKARSMLRAQERLKLTVKLTLAGAGSTSSATLTRTIGR